MNPIPLGNHFVGVLLRELPYIPHVLFRQNGKVIVLPTLDLPGMNLSNWNCVRLNRDVTLLTI
jgi:hypothetical protein